MVSETDRTKRALVSLLKTLAGIYAVTLNVTRESSDKDVSTAFRKLLRKTDPEHGGAPFKKGASFGEAPPRPTATLKIPASPL